MRARKAIWALVLSCMSMIWDAGSAREREKINPRNDEKRPQRTRDTAGESNKFSLHLFLPEAEPAVAAFIVAHQHATPTGNTPPIPDAITTVLNTTGTIVLRLEESQCLP